ncbi:MAG: hypothetical protein ABFD80_11725 [Acidobacteriota bacterium]
MNDRVPFFMSLFETRKKAPPVGVLKIDGLLFIPPRGDMIKGPGVFNSQLSCHGLTFGTADSLYLLMRTTENAPFLAFVREIGNIVGCLFPSFL